MRNPAPLLLLAAGCAAGDGRYIDSPAYRKTYDEVFRTAREEIEKRYAIAKADPVAGAIESQWDAQLGVFKDTGNRRRVKAKIEGKADGTAVVHLQVPFEKNSAEKHTLLEKEADWDKSGFDETEEQILLRRIHLRLIPLRPPADDPPAAPAAEPGKGRSR